MGTMAVKAKRRAPRRKASKPKKAKKSQTGTYRRVWSGTALYTKGGLTKKDLCITKNGKIMSKKKLMSAKKSFKNIKPWLKATKLARKELKLVGFVPCRKGTEFYKLARQYYSK